MGFFGRWNTPQYQVQEDEEDATYELRAWSVVFRDKDILSPKRVIASAFEISDTDIWFQDEYGENTVWMNRDDVAFIELVNEDEQSENREQT